MDLGPKPGRRGSAAEGRGPPWGLVEKAAIWGWEDGGASVTLAGALELAAEEKEWGPANMGGDIPGLGNGVSRVGGPSRPRGPGPEPGCEEGAGSGRQEADLADGGAFGLRNGLHSRE